MRTRSLQGGALVFALVPIAPIARAVDCTVPAPFDYVYGYYADAAWEGPAGTDCALRTSLHSGNYQPFGGGFANARLPAPEPHYRLHFRIDLSELTSLPTGTSTVTLVNLVGSTPILSGTPELGSKTASIANLQMLRMYDSYNGTLYRVLRLTAADASSVTGYETDSAMMPASREFGVDLDVVVGSPGSAKVWINTNPGGTPAIALNVQNSAWGGIAGVAIGQYKTSELYQIEQAGKSIVFSNINPPDVIFLGQFE